MGIAGHNRRLSRLEAASGATKTEPLVFSLHEWAECAPVRKGEDDDAEKVALMKAKALDRLVAAGEINEGDRDRVVFIVRVLVTPTRPEQLEPYGEPTRQA